MAINNEDGNIKVGYERKNVSSFASVGQRLFRRQNSGKTCLTNKFSHIPTQNVKASTTKICGHMDWEKGDLEV